MLHGLFSSLDSALQKKPLARFTLLVAVLLVLTCLFTYPLWISPAAYSISGGGDARMNTWILCWGSHELFKDPLSLYQGNIFFPARNTLAFSDNMLASSILALPVFAWSKNPVLIYNFVVFVSILLAGIGMYLLVHHLTGDFVAALVASSLYTFSSEHMSRIFQIQLFTSHWTPFALLYLHKFLENRSYRNLLLLSLFFVLQALSGAYNAVYLFTAITLGILFFGILERRYREVDFYVKGFLLALVIFIATFPFFLPYVENVQMYGMVRSASSVARYSPDWRAYVAMPTNFYDWFWGHFHSAKKYLFSQPPYLFPGLAPVVLTIMGLRTNRITRPQAFYVVLGVFAFIASTGSKLHLYDFLYDWLLVFKMTRVPSRFILIVILCLSVLSAYGIAWLRARYDQTGRRFYVLLGCLLFAFFLVESLAIPITNETARREVPEVYGWLRGLKEQVVVTELPFSNPWNTVYMVYSTLHWKTLTNGYSGYKPRSYVELEGRLKKFPDKASLRKLSENSDYVIIHPRYFSKVERGEIIREAAGFPDQLQMVGQFGKDLVYRLKIDLKDTRFQRYYPWEALRNKVLRFSARTNTAKPGVQERISLSVNGQFADEFLLGRAFQMYQLRIPEKLIRRGSNEITFLYGYARATEEKGPAYQIGSTGIFSPVDISAESVVSGNAGKANIYVNGRNFSESKKGYNLVVLDPGSGETESSVSFDTTLGPEASEEMILFLQKIQKGKIVVVVVKGNASRFLTREAVAALETLGTRPGLFGMQWRSQAIIGVKGARPGEALEDSSEKMSRVTVGRPFKKIGFRMKDLELVE